MRTAALFQLVEGVSSTWTRRRKAEERRNLKADDRKAALVRSLRDTVKQAAYDVMAQAYDKASTGRTLPAAARQIMYAARPEILTRAETDSLDSQYFCQRLLPDYMDEHRAETADWDVVFDARGRLTEPHTGRTVPLGTLEVRQYLKEVFGTRADAETVAAFSTRFLTCGPGNRFKALLFIEKEGFLPLFRAVKLAERYDLAIMSTKGLSVTASRRLVDTLCHEYKIPLLVLHDFDKSGFSILGTLSRSTRRYKFEHKIEPIDLGLRLDDLGDLQREKVNYKKSNPTANLRKNGATRDEIAILYQGYKDGCNVGERVELNAHTSGDLVAWIEARLRHHGIGKVIPDTETAAACFRQAVQTAYLNRHLDGLRSEAKRVANETPVPADLLEAIRARLTEAPSMSWDAAVAELAASAAGN